MSIFTDRPRNVEAPHKSENTATTFNPDRRIDVSRVGKAIENVFNPDARIGKLYTERQDRVDQAKGTKCEWTGDPGDSRAIPLTDTQEGRAAADKLAEHGQKDVRYRDGVVNFADCSVESVAIDDMTSDIEGNRSQALRAVADKWNEKGMVQDNGKKWTPNAVRDWASKNRLDFHECSDMRTCQFVPHEIHSYFKHTGGRAECRIREGQQNGGVFDA